MAAKCLMSVLLALSSYQELGLPPKPFQTSHGEPDLRCGSMCLYIGMKSLGAPIPLFDDVERRFGPAGPMGYSLDQIRVVAEQFGIHATPVVTNLDNLTRRQRPFACIAHLKTGHFVLIGDITDKSVFIVNPPYVAHELPIATFLTQWDNRALVLSSHEVQPEEALNRQFSMWQLIAIVSSALLLIATYLCARLFSKSKQSMSS